MWGMCSIFTPLSFIVIYKLKKITFCLTPNATSNALVIKERNMVFHTEENIARLIFLHMQGSISEVEAKELAAWREASPRHEALFRQMTSRIHLEESLHRFIKTPEEEQKNREALHRKLHPVSRRSLKRWWAYAALFALLLTCGILLLYRLPTTGPLTGNPPLAGKLSPSSSYPILVLPNGEQIELKDAKPATSPDHFFTISKVSIHYSAEAISDTTEIFHTLKVPRGSTYILRLSDNTDVYLNAASELTYPVKFTGKQRKVSLRGEAYFQVRKSQTYPFIVSAGQMEIRVMGTTFGIRAYSEENEIHTTLESGKVRVTVNHQQTELSPGQQALFDKQTSGLNVREVDTDVYLGWKDNRIVYDNCPLETILRDLGRQYDFETVYENPELRSYRFTLNMKKHASLQQILQLIEKTEDIHFEVKDHSILVK